MGNKVLELSNGIKNIQVAEVSKKKKKRRGGRSIGVKKGQRLIVKGKGGYFAPALGAAGGAIGGALGGWSGGKIDAWLGSGAYRPARNSLFRGGMQGNRVPYMHSSNQAIIVRHREYLSDVISSGTANTFLVGNTVVLNPGLAASFPWLSTIASNFQEYSWLGVVFEYVSSSADSIASSTNTTLGSIIMFSQYRSTAPLPTSKLQALQLEYSNDEKPSRDLCHFIECDPRENPYNIQYVRTSAVPAGEDGKTYDLGTFGCATSGLQGTNTVLGELWVSYEVELRKPILGADLGLLDDSTMVKATTATTGNPFGTATAAGGVNGIGLILPASGGVLTWPAGSIGTYYVSILWPAITALSGLGLGTFVNCTAPASFNGGAAQFEFSQAAAALTGGSINFLIIITNPSLAASVTLSATLTGASSVNVIVNQVNPALNTAVVG